MAFLHGCETGCCVQETEKTSSVSLASEALKAANLSLSKRFTMLPDCELTMPGVDVYKYCPGCVRLQGFDGVALQ